MERRGGTAITSAIAVTHRIAGIVFRTESNARLPLLQENPLEQFRIGGVEPDVRHCISKVSIDSSAAAGEFESVLLRSPLVRARLQDYLDRREQMEMQLDQDQAIIRNYSRRELDLFYTDELEGFDDPTQRAHAAAHRVATNFRRLFSTFFPSFRAVLVHSSGVIRNGRAALFLAPSTGGKTTVTRIATGDPILNDDQNVLRKEGDHIVAHSTPLGSITSGPCQARLGGFFLLEQAERFDLSPLTAHDVIEHIWNENPNYTFFLPRRLKTRAFTVLADACRQTPAYRMCFPRDYVDWDAIDAAMAK